MKTLHELFHAHPWEDVRNTLERNYPWCTQVLNAYKGAFLQLQAMAPGHSDLELILSNDATEAEEDEGETCSGVSVYGRILAPPVQTPAQLLALEYMPWPLWLGMAVSEDTLAAFPEPEILAHCLAEMTCHGFTDEDIAEAGKQLDQRIAERDRMTLEDVKKKLGLD